MPNSITLRLHAKKGGCHSKSRRAVELEPESQNAFHGAAWAANLALVFALVGEQVRRLH